MATAEDFWSDMENSQKVLQKTKQLKSKVEAYESLYNDFVDAGDLAEMADEEEDLSMLEEIMESV